MASLSLVFLALGLGLLCGYVLGHLKGYTVGYSRGAFFRNRHSWD